MNPLLVIFGIFVLALYFLPTIVGASRRAPRFGMILLINLFFGWSLLPWIFAMWMAFRSDPVRPIGAMPQAPRLTQAGNSASNNALIDTKSTPSPQMTGSTASQLSTRSPATFTVVLTLSGVSFGPSFGGGIVSMHTRWSESPFDEWIHAGVSAVGGQPTLLKVQAAKQDYGGFGSVDDSKHQIAKWTKEFMEASRPSAWNPDQVVETTLTLEGASMKDFSGDRSVTFNGRPKRLGILLADLNFHQNAIELAIWQITSGRLT